MPFTAETYRRKIGRTHSGFITCYGRQKYTKERLCVLCISIAFIQWALVNERPERRVSVTTV